MVASGHEGGLCGVARNPRELFQILGCDIEPIVDWDGIDYEREDDDEHTEGHEAYVRWLADTFGLSPGHDPNAIVATAQAEYRARFEGWWRQFMPDLLAAAPSGACLRGRRQSRAVRHSMSSPVTGRSAR